MTDFDLSAEQSAFEKEVEAFAREELAEGAAARESDHDIPSQCIVELGRRGLLGVNIPKALGGSERGVVAYALAVKNIAAADASIAVTMAVTNMSAEIIARFGSEEQKQEFVPKLVSGEFYAGAFALSEPTSGSDAASLTTRAERTPEGWRLDGEKMWITSGDRAGVAVTWARTGGLGPKGISCFLMPRGASGLRAGKPEAKMGLRASHTVTLHLDGVQLPEGAMLGQPGQGFPIAMAALDGGRIGIAAQSVGMAEAALAAARRHARKGTQQEGKPLAESQGVQFRLADMATETSAAWLMVLRAAMLKEGGDARFTREAAMAKLFASEAANRAVRSAFSIVAADGGAGGCQETSEVSRLVRDCRVTEIYEGTSEIQRLVIARHVLKAVS